MDAAYSAPLNAALTCGLLAWMFSSLVASRTRRPMHSISQCRRQVGVFTLPAAVHSSRADQHLHRVSPCQACHFWLLRHEHWASKQRRPCVQALLRTAGTLRGVSYSMIDPVQEEDDAQSLAQHIAQAQQWKAGAQHHCCCKDVGLPERSAAASHALSSVSSSVTGWNAWPCVAAPHGQRRSVAAAGLGLTSHTL